MRSLALGAVDPELRIVRPTDELARQLTFMVPALVDKFEVEALSSHCQHHAENVLGKGFAEADALAAIEW